MFSPGICGMSSRRAEWSRAKPHPELEVNLAWATTNYKRFAVDQDRMALLPAPQAFELRPRLVVEPLCELRTGALAMTRRLEVAEERLRAQLAYLLARGPAYGRVRGDEADALQVAMLGREPLDQRVGVRRVAHRERPSLGVLSDAVEHHDAAGTLQRHEAGERVDELAGVREGAGVKQVVAVEEIQRRLGHRRTLLLRAPPLAPRLVQENARRDAHVQRLDSAEEWDRDSFVARSTNERAQALSLRPENERDAAGQVGFPHRSLGVAR